MQPELCPAVAALAELANRISHGDIERRRLKAKVSVRIFASIQDLVPGDPVLLEHRHHRGQRLLRWLQREDLLGRPGQRLAGARALDEL
jgi:hypothetical protein